MLCKGDLDRDNSSGELQNFVSDYLRTRTAIGSAVAFRKTTQKTRGLISACKAVISEASDNTNQALGMTIVGTA